MAHAARLLKEMHRRREIEGKNSSEQRERDQTQCPSHDAESTQAGTSSTIAFKILLRMLGLTISHSWTVTQKDGLSERLAQLKIEVTPVSETEEAAAQQT